MKTFKLSDVAEIIVGADKPKIFSTNKNSSNKIPVIANAEKNLGLYGYTDTARITEPAITIAARGSNVGFTALRKEPYYPIIRLLSLVPKKNLLDVNYLYYSLKHNRQTGIGSGQPQITIPDISNRKISLPPIHTQKKVSEILSYLDEKIELNNKINDELEAMAKLIYEYWFIQFDFPDSNGKPYKSSGGRMVFNKNVNREIPKDWNSIPISSLLNIKTGKEDANFATSNGEYPFFTCGEKILKCENYAFEGKAVLLAGNGTFGIKRYMGKLNAYQRTYVLIPNDESNFSHIFFAVKAQTQQLTDGSRGSIVKFITVGDIANINLVLPPNPSVCSAELLNNIFDRSDALNKENEELAKFRDWLLPMLINGQVTVTDAG